MGKVLTVIGRQGLKSFIVTIEFGCKKPVLDVYPVSTVTAKIASSCTLRLRVAHPHLRVRDNLSVVLNVSEQLSDLFCAKNDG